MRVVFFVVSLMLAGCGVPDTAGPAGPLPGFGEISGACRVLDDSEWNSPNTALFQNAIEFTAPYSLEQLSPGGQEVITDGGLNASSVYSEAIAHEMLARCEDAELLKTEIEIVYVDPDRKKTDLLVRMDGRQIGVSVTRAVAYPLGSPYEASAATALLEKKLGDLPLSAANASPGDAWERSVLHVIAYDQQHADLVEATVSTLNPAIVGDAIIIVTATHGADGFIYP